MNSPNNQPNHETLSVNQPTKTALENRLREHLKPTYLEVLDETHLHHGHAGANVSGFGSHFRVRIAASSFVGRKRVEQHRLVYDSLQDFMNQGLHALAIEILPFQS